jgi:hypothetical protein
MYLFKLYRHIYYCHFHMKKLLIFFLLCIAIKDSEAQQPITFERTYSDSGVVEGRRIRQTFDEGYIVAGRRNSIGAFFSNDGTLTKIDSLGNMEWTKVYGTSFDDDWLNDVQQTTDSGFVACGYYPEMGMAENIYIVKTNKNGDTLWTKVYGSNLADIARAVTQTYDGGYIVAGQWDTTGILLRLTPQGDTLWTKRVYDGYISLYSVEQTLDSGFVATGVLNTNTVTLNLQVYVVRIDKNGNILWEKNYGYEGADYGHSIKVLPNGNYVVGGYSWQPPNDYDPYLLQLNTNGDTIWTKVYHDLKENGIVELALCQDGGFAFAEAKSVLGQSYQLSIARVDSLGNFLWRREYGGVATEYTYGITACRDGGFALCALSSSFGSFSEMYLVKTNASGLLTALVQLEDKQTAIIKVGPNPFKDRLNLDLTGLLEKEYQVILYDILGNQILNKSIQGGTKTCISINRDLPASTYFLKIHDKSNVLVTFPVIHY